MRCFLLLPVLALALSASGQLPPPRASVSDVVAGTNNYKYVTPLGLSAGGTNNQVGVLFSGTVSNNIMIGPNATSMIESPWATNAIYIGCDPVGKVSGDGIKIGGGGGSVGNRSIVIGHGAGAGNGTGFPSTGGSTAIGEQTDCFGFLSVAIGDGMTVDYDFNLCIAPAYQAQGTTNNIVIGFQQAAYPNADNQTVIGTEAGGLAKTRTQETVLLGRLSIPDGAIVVNTNASNKPPLSAPTSYGQIMLWNSNGVLWCLNAKTNALTWTKTNSVATP